ncbi:hypothetical protein ACI2LC_15345 [Nonomuraea wenchangensis]|uniref:hypothetical protein n=1 Tax=Nonomuraea wenchangensis TaxID=568860 RepID=UPI0034014C3E
MKAILHHAYGGPDVLELEDVPTPEPGDEVFGCAGGAFAEYVTVRHDGPLLPKPAGLTFEQAAAVPTSAITALLGLRDHARGAPAGTCWSTEHPAA